MEEYTQEEQEVFNLQDDVRALEMAIVCLAQSIGKVKAGVFTDMLLGPITLMRNDFPGNHRVAHKLFQLRKRCIDVCEIEGSSDLKIFGDEPL
jgi:hypothetical protein